MTPPFGEIPHTGLCGKRKNQHENPLGEVHHHRGRAHAAARLRTAAWFWKLVMVRDDDVVLEGTREGLGRLRKMERNATLELCVREIWKLWENDSTHNLVYRRVINKLQALKER